MRCDRDPSAAHNSQLLSVTEPEFWEITDRGVNFDYVPPDLRPPPRMSQAVAGVWLKLAGSPVGIRREGNPRDIYELARRLLRRGLLEPPGE